MAVPHRGRWPGHGTFCGRVVVVVAGRANLGGLTDAGSRPPARPHSSGHRFRTRSRQPPSAFKRQFAAKVRHGRLSPQTGKPVEYQQAVRCSSQNPGRTGRGCEKHSDTFSRNTGIPFRRVATQQRSPPGLADRLTFPKPSQQLLSQLLDQKQRTGIGKMSRVAHQKSAALHDGAAGLIAKSAFRVDGANT